MPKFESEPGGDPIQPNPTNGKIILADERRDTRTDECGFVGPTASGQVGHHPLKSPPGEVAKVI